MKSVVDSRISFEKFNLGQWLEYIQSRHARSIDMTLERVSRVWTKLGQKNPPCTITVAGTNGKGSTVCMLESMLKLGRQAIGVYTSPHLVRFNERIKINGQEASDHELCAAFCEIEHAVKDISLTYFEYSTLCALWLFSKYSVDIQILEVGMGGRLDAVNIIDSDVVVITSIGLDHEAWLGNDRESIALEKAEVMRKGRTAICSDRNMPKSLRVFAQEKAVDLKVIGCDFDVRVEHGSVFWYSRKSRFLGAWQRLGPIPLHLAGLHQKDNLAGAVAALAVLSSRLCLDPADVVSGMSLCSFSGRCQILRRSPIVIVDVAHNKDSAIALSHFIHEQSVVGQTSAVFGALKDKNLEHLVRPMLSHIDQWHLTGIAGDRGQSSNELKHKFKTILNNHRITCHEDPKSAYRSALASASPEDRIVVFGSFHVAGDILELVDGC